MDLNLGEPGSIYAVSAEKVYGLLIRMNDDKIRFLGVSGNETTVENARKKIFLRV